MKNRLKIERAILDLTQEELANKIGVSRQTISSIEKNRYIPSTVLSLRLSNLFKKPVNDFFELDENEKINRKQNKNKIVGFVLNLKFVFLYKV